ncbi:YaeQ family protein [Thiomicrorhabdus xiamenensis]|uniref:YaeQ family protein n=1 Tax=Thiomicrorhabdus xiamenensis TaxID=2739063 RepID=A0A7D4SYZ8_9GAMM|nr:YaeQ family protein [Thiomicrorhabdus xiamenensis]QKI88282.1 YaeQ family protein [Thiomicrorhabdus xiamenensis]
MALKPTVYKFKISLSDLNRSHYDAISLTVAKHPSENDERMMTRLLAYCLNAQEGLDFGAGLSEVDDPAISLTTLDDQLALWIDVGEPAVDRIKKASRKAQKVRVYSFNSKSDVWWEQGQAQFSRLEVDVYRFNWNEIQAFAAMLERTMDFSVTISGNSAYIAAAKGECEVHWEALLEKE